jgi:3-oxoacyl-[acyl-carrier-protein] synthase II
MNLPHKRVVVTGIGALTPLGNSVPAYWEGLINGVSGADFITQFDASKFKTRFACEVKGFNPEDYFERKEARKLDRFSQFAVAVAVQAVEDAGISKEGVVNQDRVGVIWASGIGGMITFIEEMKNFNSGDGTPRFSPFFIPKLILDIASGHISMRYGFRGPNFSTVSACASSTNSVIDALNYIRLGKADAIVCGGSEAVVTEAGIGGFNAMKALSERNDAPNCQSSFRPRTRWICNGRRRWLYDFGRP